MGRDRPHRSRTVRVTPDRLPHRHHSTGPVARWLNTAQPEALFVLSAIAQYVGAVIAVGLFDEVEPRTVAWFRVIGAAIALVVVSRAWRGRWTRSELAAAALFGIATALMNLFFYLAIDRIDLGKAVTIEFIGPIAVAAVATRSVRNAVALLFAVAGVVVLGGGEIEGNAIGLLFIGLASAMWAAYIVIGSRVARLDRGVGGLGSRAGDRCARDRTGRRTRERSTCGRHRACWRCVCWSACSRTRSATASTSSRCAASRSAASRCCSRCCRSPPRSSAGSCSTSDRRRIEMIGIALVLVGVMVQEREELAPLEAEVLTEPS